MKANKKTLLALKSMFENEQDYYDLEEMVGDIIVKTNLLKHKEMGEHTLATDECGIEWGGDTVCVLAEFVDSYTRLFLENICNMIESFVGEDISCYFEDEE